MKRLVGVLVFSLMLAGCKDDSAVRSAAVPSPAPTQASVARAANGAGSDKIAYNHKISLEMARDQLQARFEKARALCESDPAIHCTLLRAQLNLFQANPYSSTNAELELRLAHDSVVPFQTRLLEKLPGEASAPTVASISTMAQDLSQSFVDIEQRRRQLTDYRDRLLALQQRPDAKIEDLMKVASELSNIQGNLEAGAKAQSELQTKVDTEYLVVDMTGTASAIERGVPSIWEPLRQVWYATGANLISSMAVAFRFLITALPWLPVMFGGVWLLRLGWRRLRR